MSMRAGNIPRESTSVIAAENILSVVAPAFSGNDNVLEPSGQKKIRIDDVADFGKSFA